MNLFLILGAGLAQDHNEGEPPHWEYEGEAGPENWGSLSEDFALCGSGTTQSPIDIVETYSVNVDDIVFNYSDSNINILNNGHTIQVNYDEGSSIEFDGTTYDLLQFHFHHPSEHTINGEVFPMELHFVHRDAESHLAVVGVMLAEGAENTAFNPIWEAIPAEASEVITVETLINGLNLMPEDRTFYTYSGSLTTPPCSEGVRWLLLDTPIELSAEQIEAFGAIYELNAHPVQSQNARDVLQDSQ